MHKKIMSLACAAFIGVSIAGASTWISNANENEIEKTSGSVEIVQDNYSSDNDIRPRISVNTGGGSWSYGTNIEIYPGQKYVWSNYTHNSKIHGSSATIGGKTNSTCAAKGKTSYASIVGSKNALGKANWNTSCSL